MKEEETMQYLFKHMFVAVLTVLGVAFTIVPVHAQSGSRVIANIPFDFSVGNTTLKAGSYTVEQLESGRLLAFSSSDGREHCFESTFPGDSDRQSQEPSLVFTQYGSKAFLKKVVFSSDEADELPESRGEKELIKSRAFVAELSLVQPAR
jgi:hypothetical protein